MSCHRPFATCFALVLLMLGSQTATVPLARAGDDPPPDPALLARIETLESELRRSANPDSIRMLLAAAHRDVGTLENRILSLTYLKELRTSYFSDVGYQEELALTYLACGQPMVAMHSFFFR